MSTENISIRRMFDKGQISEAEAENQQLCQALAYFHRGWKIMPLHHPIAGGCSCGRQGCISVGKHPAAYEWKKGGEYADFIVEQSPDSIREWFEANPYINIGILTGKISSKLFVLDVDGPEGEKSVEGLYIPNGPRVLTGRGRHIYLQCPGGLDVRNHTGILKGVDIRGNGGYVVAPPSLHHSGSHYEWTDDSFELPLPECPGWLLELMEKKKTGRPVRI